MLSYAGTAITSRMIGQVAIWHMGENSIAQEVKVRKPKGMRQLGSPKHTQDNIEIDLKEVRWHYADWIAVRDMWRAHVNKVTTL